MAWVFLRTHIILGRSDIILARRGMVFSKTHIILARSDIILDLSGMTLDLSDMGFKPRQGYRGLRGGGQRRTDVAWGPSGMGFRLAEIVGNPD